MFSFLLFCFVQRVTIRDSQIGNTRKSISPPTGQNAFGGSCNNDCTSKCRCRFSTRMGAPEALVRYAC
eukprot:3149766-Pyramimonas_sp.AAC.1